VDLNGDGHKDIISGSWPGEIFFFKGDAYGMYAAPEMLKDKDGQLINPGGGIEERSNGGLLFRGTVEWKQTDEGSVVVYRGKEYKNTPEKPLASTGCASTVRAVDWDGDGDLDLIVGHINGTIYLVSNEGTAKAYAFGKEEVLQVDGKPLKVQSGRAGPDVADWDGDGDLDLLVGAEDGHVSLYRNIGSATAPKLAEAEELVSAGLGYTRNPPRDAQRGRRAKICAADWNGDGKLDLLVGDRTSQKPDLPEPTAEEKAEHERIRKELAEVRKEYSPLAQKLFGSDRPTDEEELKKLNEKFSEVRTKMTELNSKLPKESETHGWVWLFLRK